MKLTVHGRDEAIPSPRHRLNEARRFCRVAQHCAQALHGSIQPVLEVHEGVFRPEALPKLVAGYQFTGAFEQSGQDLQRLLRQAQSHARLSQLA